VFWLIVAAELLHVLSGIFWFGSALMTTFILVPALSAVPFEDRRRWAAEFVGRYGPIVAFVAGLTIVLGITRGIVEGVLGSIATPYGITWITALALGIVVAVVGAKMVSPAMERFVEAAEPGQSDLALMRMRTTSRLQLAGLFALFLLMIAMHFGY
jgi:uncharacterized membrane protein